MWAFNAMAFRYRCKVLASNLRSRRVRCCIVACQLVFPIFCPTLLQVRGITSRHSGTRITRFETLNFGANVR
ncbi:hypothetical protein BDZ94DRAFT_1257709 [Collybia nuda]|uniref:Uncharacterized protein n=1 Tax=Collybia nuda TaxID=64659 RepID=A0A9P5Y731_9AGAR|nr:hypothetical protein BDZ94DRAFT_1257709 [Collybia nuda]